jgi:hypothetical protein
MITTQHSKVKTTGEQLRSFISYFQSISTIGIINRARSAAEADEKARKKLDNSDFMCGVVGQTPFELYATDEWKPQIDSQEELEQEQEQANSSKNYSEDVAFQASKDLLEKEALDKKDLQELDKTDLHGNIDGWKPCMTPSEFLAKPDVDTEPYREPNIAVIPLNDKIKLSIAKLAGKDPKDVTIKDKDRLAEYLVLMGIEYIGNK